MEYVYIYSLDSLEFNIILMYHIYTQYIPTPFILKYHN